MASTFTSLSVTIHEHSGVGVIELNRPSRHNAMNTAFFDELPSAVQLLDTDASVRAIVLLAAGKHFCSGIDLQVLSSILAETKGDGTTNADGCEGRRRESMRRGILHMQAAMSSLEECRKPVIAGVQGACIGGGIDLITACDFRYCSESAFFSVKEVDLAIVADLGTLQRLPKIIGEGNARELAVTARIFSAAEAHRMGLVQKVFLSDAQMRDGVLHVAQDIAKKSPLAVLGTKRVMNFSSGRSVSEGLEYSATWNSAMLISDDISRALKASRTKTSPHFSRL